MIDSTKLNNLLHSNVPQYYRVKPGDSLQIDLPRIPLTGPTQYLQLTKETRGDRTAFIEEAPPSPLEGNLLPRRIVGKAVHPGKYSITWHATNRLTKQVIQNVEPLNIVVDVEPDE